MTMTNWIVKYLNLRSKCEMKVIYSGRQQNTLTRLFEVDQHPKPTILLCNQHTHLGQPDEEECCQGICRDSVTNIHILHYM